MKIRQNFTKNWESFTSNQKSLLISFFAICFAILLLNGGKLVFPEYDFSSVEAIVITGLTGFIVSVVKNFIKL